MNKKALAEGLELSLTTISRYIGMGLPYEKIGNKYDFDLSEVQNWIDDNIDRREPERSEKMTPTQASAKACELLERLIPYVDFEKMIKDIGRGK